jgi:hypothetical protein
MQLVLVGGAPARGSKPQALAGTTTISSSTTTVAHVLLPRPVKVSTSPFKNDLFEIKSRGRLAGAVLKQDVVRGGAEAMSLQFSLCAKAPCDRRPLGFTQVYETHHSFSRKTTLPAGPYLLYVVADGVPTTVDVHLPGLAGKSKVRPDAAADYSLDRLSPEVPVAGTTPTYRGFADASIPHMGMTVAALEVRSDKNLADKFDVCVEELNRQLPVSPDYCLASAGGSVIMTSRGRDDHRALVVSSVLAGAGDYRHRLSLETASLVEDVNTIAFSLDYGSGRRVGGSSSLTWFTN